MKILILGGSQFVGRAIVDQALSQNHEVSVISLTEPHRVSEVEWINVDRTNLVSLEAALKDKSFEIVIDNIAYNVSAVDSLLKLITGKTRRYVLTSTVDLYTNDRPHRIKESSENITTWTTGYAGSKLACENLLKQYNFPLERVIIRPSIVIGRYDNIPRPDKTIPRSLFFPARVTDGGPILLPHFAHRPFNLAFADDVGKAIMIAATHADAPGKTMNVTNPELWTLERLVSELGRVNGTNNEVVRDYPIRIQQNLPKYLIPYNISNKLTDSWSMFDTTMLESLGWNATPLDTWLPTLFNNLDEYIKDLEPSRAEELTFIESIKRPDIRHYVNGYTGDVLSRIGIGTYMGSSTDAEDAAYAGSINASLDAGLNVIDTAINYRDSRSEKVIGTILNDRNRENIFLIGKGGYANTTLKNVLLGEKEIALGHSMRAEYVYTSLKESLSNLKTKIDCFLIHNAELGLEVTDVDQFYRELFCTFVMLEQKVAEGVIGSYGISTWYGLRVARNNKLFLDMNRVMECARAAADTGKQHNFKAIELPFNPVNNEASCRLNQTLNGNAVSIFEYAKIHNLQIFTSNSVNYGDEIILAENSDLTHPQTSIHFAASQPAVTTALVGMRKLEHVADAAAVNNLSDMSQSDITDIHLLNFKKL